MGNRLCDLTHLLLPYRQITHGLHRVYINVEFFKKLCGFLIHPFIVNEDSFFKLPPYENILCHRQMP